MTIADQITRLNNAKAAIKQSIENKGVEVSDTALLDEYPALIDSIEVGGDGGDPYYRTMWNAITNNGTRCEYLFYNCSSLTSLDLSKLDTSNATTMSSMFYKCTSLTSLDLSNFDTSNVTYMGSMFNGCSNLQSLDLSNFDTSSVTAMTSMFNGCSKLTTLDLSNFDTSSITNISNMFGGCGSLHTLHLDNCNNKTINKIITSPNFQTNAISGVIRTIYCRESEAAGLTPPGNWVFSYIEE